MISNERMQAIVTVFQASFKRDNSAELRAIPLGELKKVDEMLGSRDLNEGFRLRLRNRIAELEDEVRRKDNRRSRIVDHAVGFIAGVVIALIGVLLT
jgi:hypothetical protein